MSAKRWQKLRSWRARSTLALFAVLLAAWPAVLWAHPLGNFTVNRYNRLVIGPTEVRLLYIIDMAEIPTQQEVAVVDRNRDGQMSDEEQTTYLAEMTTRLAANLHLFLNDQHVTWQVAEQTLEFPPGQADLPTLRVSIVLTTALDGLAAATTPWQADYLDDNYADRLGWKEVIVQAQPGVTLVESDAPTQDLSDELRAYPEDLLQEPANQNSAQFQFTLVAQSNSTVAQPQTAPAPTAGTVAGLTKPTDRFAELITIPTLGPGAILLALVAAFGWGALHALSPGHGKTIVAAYLVGSRGTVKHALFLGLTTTVTHTAGVFALGFVTLFLSRYILPETLYPWLGFLSGLLVVLIGLSLVWGRLRGLLGWPSTDARGHDHSHAHDHAHDHAHSHGFLIHDHGDGHTHSHAPPGADGQPVTWRTLLVLGVSGGLLPCPSALVLMLGAIALERVAFGLVLILIFSIGLASVLTAIGVALVYARHLFDHLPEGGRWVRVLPVASAALITVVGIGIAWQALVQTGVLGLG